MTRTALTLLTATLLIPSALSFPTLNVFKRAARPIPYPISDPTAVVRAQYESRQPPLNAREPCAHCQGKRLDVEREAQHIEVDFHRFKRWNNTDPYGNSSSLNSTETLPMIMEPSNGTVWTTGETRNITWTTTDQNGDLFDIIKQTEHVKVKVELRTRDAHVFAPIIIANVTLSKGWHTIVVPHSALEVGERNDWIIVLVGKPSHEFIIVPPGASTTPVPVPIESSTNPAESTPTETSTGTPAETSTEASSTPAETSTEVSSTPFESSTAPTASSESTAPASEAMVGTSASGTESTLAPTSAPLSFSEVGSETTTASV